MIGFIFCYFLAPILHDDDGLAKLCHSREWHNLRPFLSPYVKKTTNLIYKELKRQQIFHLPIIAAFGTQPGPLVLLVFLGSEGALIII